MLSKTVFTLAFLLVCSTSLAHGTDRYCRSWQPGTNCLPGAAFSVDNVHQIHETTASEGPPFYDASWHEREPILAYVAGCFCSSDEKYLLFTRWRDSDYALANTASLLSMADPERSYTRVLIVSDMIIAGTMSGHLQFWDLMEEKLLFEQAVGNGEVTAILLHPTGGWLVVAIANTYLYRVDLDMQTVTEVNLLGNEDQVLEAMAFSDEGHLLAAAGGGTVAIWESGSWAAWEPQPIPSGMVGLLRFTDNDRSLLVSSGGTVDRWSLSDRSLSYGQQLQPYAGRRECAITVGDISVDGSLLTTGDVCGQYRAWDLAADAEMYIPQLHERFEGFPVEVLEFRPDGRVLFMGNYGGFGYLIIHQPE